MTEDLEATQDIQNPETPAPKSNVKKFTGVPYRITAESVVRHLLSQVDKIEDIGVVFRVKGHAALMLNYSSEISSTDLAIAGLTMTSLAEQKMGLVESKPLHYSPLDPESP